MKEKVRKILMIVLIILLSYLLIANIIHGIAINKKQAIPGAISDSTTKIIKKDYQILIDNVNKLKKIKRTQHLDEKTYGNILKGLEENVTKIKGIDIININIDGYYNDRQLYQLLNKFDGIINLSVINSYQIINENDSNSGFELDRIINSYLDVIIHLSLIENKLINNHQYHSINNNIFNPTNLEIDACYLNVGKNILLLRELSDYLVRDGGINE